MNKRPLLGALSLVAPLLLLAPPAVANPDAFCSDYNNSDAAFESRENEVITLINQRRAAGATCGRDARPPVAALVLNNKLRCAARKHAKDMATKNFFRPTGSDGSTYSQRIKSAGFVGSVGESINAGHATAVAVVNAWMDNQVTCTYLMNVGFKNVGVGYFSAESSTYRHYWTLSFGTPP